MNPFILGLLGMFVRQAVLVLAGALGIGPLVQAYVDQHLSQFNQFSLSVAGLIVAVGYAGYRHVRKHQQLLQAARAASLTVREVAQQVADPRVSTPSVLTPTDEVPR